jgi:hypothetical protein
MVFSTPVLRITGDGGLHGARYAARAGGIAHTLSQPAPPEPPQRAILWSRLAGTRSCVGVQSLMTTSAGVKIPGHISSGTNHALKTMTYSVTGRDGPAIKFLGHAPFHAAAAPICCAQAAHMFCTACSHAAIQASLQRIRLPRFRPWPRPPRLRFHRRRIQPPAVFSPRPANQHLKLLCPPADRLQRHCEAAGHLTFIHVWRFAT